MYMGTIYRTVMVFVEIIWCKTIKIWVREIVTTFIKQKNGPIINTVRFIDSWNSHGTSVTTSSKTTINKTIRRDPIIIDPQTILTECRYSSKITNSDNTESTRVYRIISNNVRKCLGIIHIDTLTKLENIFLRCSRIQRLRYHLTLTSYALVW